MLMRRITDLTYIHSHLDESFLWHQEFIVQMQWRTALELLREFSKELDAHIHEEEEILLPAYEKRVQQPVGGSAEQFRLEHRRLQLLMKEFLVREEELAETGSRDLRDAIHLIEEQARFKHLMLHHDQRERSFLYPLLDIKLGSDERRDLINRIEGERAGDLKFPFYFQVDA